MLVFIRIGLVVSKILNFLNLLKIRARMWLSHSPVRERDVRRFFCFTVFTFVSKQGVFPVTVATEIRVDSTQTIKVWSTATWMSSEWFFSSNELIIIILKSNECIGEKERTLFLEIQNRLRYQNTPVFKNTAITYASKSLSGRAYRQ